MALPSHMLSLSLDDWERIGFYTVASQSTFQGPPSALCALSLVSRHVHNVISVKRNSRLYARIFRFKFDYAAPVRRLTERWLTSRCLADELIKRFAALRRIRLQREFKRDDLWTCYLMMSENDGKNESQLQWANLKQYLAAMSVLRTHPSPFAWHKDLISDSLMTWLMWMTTSRADVAAEEPEFVRLMSQISHPLIVAGYRSPSTFAPDSCFHLPISEESDMPLQHCSGPPPPKSEIVYYSHKLVLAAPMATSAAILNTTVRAEKLQDADTFPRVGMSLPRDRAAADALGLLGPTLADLWQFHYAERIHVADPCIPVIGVDFDQESMEEESADTPLLQMHGSERYDEEWSRLVSCHDPTVGPIPLRGMVYRVGSLAGSWAGRFLQPDVMGHMNLVLNPNLSPLSTALHHQPLYWNLKEHHCLLPDEPVCAGTGIADDDDLLNAWLPRGIEVTFLEDAIEVFDPNTDLTTRYETFLPGSPAPYSKSACEKLERPWISDEEITESGSDSDLSSGNPDSSIPSTSYIDDDDEYVDTVSHKSSGVCDILITGETGQGPGAAWGHYTIIGRVRPWDGLIVLLRTPHPNQAHLGQWIFKGYIHDQNFVGRWRETSTAVGMTGLEGGFVVHRREEQ